MLNNIWNISAYFFKPKKAQATIEAAIMIPVIFVLLLLLLQPGIILYDIVIMNNACTETCRVLSTASSNEKDKLCDSFARRRLSAIPQQDNFHVHSSGCTYEIELEGDHSTPVNTVTIKNQIKPLPLIGFLTEIFGMLNQNKCFEIIVSSSLSLKPEWVSSCPQGTDPTNWAGKWLTS